MPEEELQAENMVQGMAEAKLNILNVSKTVSQLLSGVDKLSNPQALATLEADAQKVLADLQNCVAKVESLSADAQAAAADMQKALGDVQSIFGLKM